MSESNPDYESALEYEIFDQGNVVTYRFLSRKLKVHVNKAKEYLYAFKTKSPETVHATYILTGTIEETAPKGAKNSNAFSNDYQPVKILSSPFFSDEASATRQLRSMKLVSEHELEESKKTFKSLGSIHIYSLSSSKKIDLTQFTTTEKSLHDLDSKLPQGALTLFSGKLKNPLLSDDYIMGSTEVKQEPSIKPQSIATPQVQKKSAAPPPEAKASFFAKAQNQGSGAKKSGSTSESKPESKPASKPESKKVNPLAAAFAIQSKTPKRPKEKVIFSNPKDQETESVDDDLEMNEPETSEEKARKKEELQNMFRDDENVMGDEKSEDEPMISDVDELEDEPMEEAPVIDIEDDEKDEEVIALETKESTPKEEKASSADPSSEAKPKRRKQKKVMKKVTKVDQLGYLITRTEEVYESCSESEDDASIKPTTAPIPPAIPSVPVRQAKKSSGKGKQASLKSFFKPR